MPAALDSVSTRYSSCGKLRTWSNSRIIRMYTAHIGFQPSWTPVLMHISLRQVFILCLVSWQFGIGIGLAQSLSPSPKWAKPTITTKQQDRIQIAKSALDLAYSRLDPWRLTYSRGESFSILLDRSLRMENVQGEEISGIWTSVNLHTELSIFDHVANQTSFKNQVNKYFEMRGEGSGNLSTPDSDFELTYYLWYGYAAFSAYDAYKDPSFLTLAEGAWSRGNNQTVTDENLSLWQSVCNTESPRLIGGVYFNTSLTTFFVGHINGLFLVCVYQFCNKLGASTVNESKYFRLSALLAEATSNATYLDAAAKSANFILNNLFSTQNVVQTIDVKEGCASPRFDPPITEHTGLWIEGLSILASIPGTPSTVQPLDKIPQAVEAATQWSGWQDEDGILNNHQQATIIAQGNMIRSLGVAYRRLPSSVDLQSYIQSYISVQYNAVLERARNPNTDIYGFWTGPPSSSFESDNQTSAVAVMLTVISLPEISSDDDSTTPSIAVIVGGVVGGVVFLALVVAALVCFHRRRKAGIGAISPPSPYRLSKGGTSMHTRGHPTVTSPSRTFTSTTTSTSGSLEPISRRLHVKSAATTSGISEDQEHPEDADPPAYSDVT
uniref:Glycoside hydrolase family 76 protein n=1 Tax=Moniliophthora roreri TaxID=221103 RepID=A0A0W0GC55_MONRR